jgi:biotin carboxylase
MNTWFVLVESNTTGTGRDFAVAARRHGLRPVLLTADPDKYDYVAELDLDVRLVDTADSAAVITTCRKLDGRLAGIASSSEYFVATAAQVAAGLGLRAQDAAAIERCRNKAEQRRWLHAAGVPVPGFVSCVTPAQAAAAARGGPVVVKPVYGSGSIGVRRCADSRAAFGWARRLLAGSATEILVEREVTGPEFSVEIIDGAPVGVTRKHVGELPYFVETGHDYPAPVPAADTSALETVAVRAVHAIGHTVGPAHVELRLPPDGPPTIIEINPRLAGGLIPRLVRYATGRDLVDETVAGAAGLPRTEPVPGNGFAAIRFLIPWRDGEVAEVTGLSLARGLPGVVEAECRLSPGDRVSAEHSFVDRRGHVIGTGVRAEDAIAAAERGVAEIRICFQDERGVRHADSRATQRYVHPADGGDARRHAMGTAW